MRASTICGPRGRGHRQGRASPATAGWYGHGFAEHVMSGPAILAGRPLWRANRAVCQHGKPARSCTPSFSWAWTHICAAGSAENLLGREAAFRRWAEPDPGVRDAEALVPLGASQPPAVVGPSGSGGPAAGFFGGFLAGYRSHLCVVVSRKTVCCACFQVAPGGRLEVFRNSQCQGVAPVERVPPFFRDGLRRLGVVAASGAGLARCQTLATAVGGNAALLRCNAKVPGGGRGLPAPGSHQVSAFAVALLAASRANAA